MTKMMDKNDDGKITIDELPDRMQQRFESLDANGNGVFDREEHQAAMERIKQRAERGPKRSGKNPEDKRGVKPKRPPAEDREVE